MEQIFTKIVPTDVQILNPKNVQKYNSAHGSSKNQEWMSPGPRETCKN